MYCTESLQLLAWLHFHKDFVVPCFGTKLLACCFSVRVEEVKGEREASRSRDSDISGAFGATYLPGISQLPWHFLKRATHYQAHKMRGDISQ